MISQPTHMDEAQGANEARNEPYKRYGEVSTGIGNAVIRHEPPARPAVLDDRAVVREVVNA